MGYIYENFCWVELPQRPYYQHDNSIKATASDEENIRELLEGKKPPNLGLRIIVPDREREQGRFKGSSEGAGGLNGPWKSSPPSRTNPFPGHASIR